MGEVKVKIKLTNNTDTVMAQRGLISKDEIRSIEIEGVVDTGEVSLTMPSHVVERLGLARKYKQVAQYADGWLEEVDVTEPVTLEIMSRQTDENALVLGDEILIGQTVLEKTDLLVDCTRQQLLPNPAHPNQPVMKVR